MEVSTLAVHELPHLSQHPLYSSTSVLINQEAQNDTVVPTDAQQGDRTIAQKTVTTPTAEPLHPPTSSSNAQFWQVFGSTFITIFLAELGDKTQMATLLMSAESHAPWSVFAGAALALITTSLVGVLVGQWLSSRVSPKALDTAAGITLALLSLWLLWDVVKM